MQNLHTIRERGGMEAVFSNRRFDSGSEAIDGDFGLRLQRHDHFMPVRPLSSTQRQDAFQKRLQIFGVQMVGGTAHTRQKCVAAKDHGRTPTNGERNDPVEVTLNVFSLAPGKPIGRNQKRPSIHSGASSSS